MTSAPGSAELVRIDVTDGVATLTLDSVHNRNALSARLRSDLMQHLSAVGKDPSVRVVVLTHTGPVFCSGADLGEARNGDPEQAAEELVQILGTLMASSQPTIVALAGPARAGGIGLVAACDFAVAAPEATFAFTEVRIGVVPSVISVPLRRKVGTATLQRLFLTGETFSAEHAAAVGLVSHVCPQGALEQRVSDLAGELCLGAPRAQNAVRELFATETTALGREFAEMRDLSARFFASEDAREGIRAFSEHRPPRWATSPASRRAPASNR